MKIPRLFHPLQPWYTLLVLPAILTGARAQQPNSFFWGLAVVANAGQTSFAECETVPLKVIPGADGVSTGVAPYFFQAFVSGGVSTATLAGSDRNNLTWVVNQRAGSTILASMKDSNDSSGGSPMALWTITPGDTSCLPPLPPADFKVVANVTGNINTCDAWGLTITGGQKPYNITLTQTNSPHVTNVSLTADQDFFAFIDRADPNEQLIASVIDATGRFGISTTVVKTHGAKVTDKSCIGLNSRGGNAAIAAQQNLQHAQFIAALKKKQSSTLAGALIAVLIALLLLGIGAFIWFRRRKARRSLTRRADKEGGSSEKLDITSRPYMGLPDLSTPPIPQPKQLQPENQFDTNRFVAAPIMIPAAAFPFPQSFSPSATSPSQTLAPSNASMRSNSTSPRPKRSVNPQWQRKVAERSASAGSAAASGSGSRAPTHTPGMSVGGDNDAAVVFQHRDAGAQAVRELPPPYMDRSINRTTAPPLPIPPEVPELPASAPLSAPQTPHPNIPPPPESAGPSGSGLVAEDPASPFAGHGVDVKYPVVS